MSNDVIESSVARITAAASPRTLIHQLLNAVGVQRDGELSGPWLVAALGELGHRPEAVRQMLRRMQRTRELEVRRQGRVNHYRLGPFARSGADAGWRKLFGPLPDWDGRWTLALYQFRASEREERDHVRVILAYAGFGSLARGVFVHPHDRVKEVTAGLGSVGLGRRVHLFRAERAAGPGDPQTAAAAWDLAALAADYRRFTDAFAGLDPDALDPAAAFRAASAVAIGFLDVGFRDPDLPAGLLPSDWPGDAARARVRALLPRLQHGMLAHADRLPG
ncbi:MAG: PaaX family transcriptional regulator C-terminal domain-containing protein [Myxococcota bacterium]